jgi:hypothetical protein
MGIRLCLEQQLFTSPGESNAAQGPCAEKLSRYAATSSFPRSNLFSTYQLQLLLGTRRIYADPNIIAPLERRLSRTD